MPKALKALFALTVTVLVVALGCELIAFVRETREAERELVPRIDKTLQDADAAMVAVVGIQRDTTRTEAEMAGLLNQTRRSMLTAAQEQQLVSNANRVLADADRAVQQFGDAAQSLGTAGPAVAETVRNIGGDSHDVLAASLQGAEALTTDLQQPEIKAAADAMERAAESTAETARNAADASADIKVWVHRETTPVRGTWNIVKAFLREFAGPAAQVAAAAK